MNKDVVLGMALGTLLFMVAALSVLLFIGGCVKMAPDKPEVLEQKTTTIEAPFVKINIKDE